MAQRVDTVVCPRCDLDSPAGTPYCPGCGASLRDEAVKAAPQVSDDVLWRHLVTPQMSRTQVAAMTPEAVLKMVNYRREHKAPAEIRTLPLTGEEIAARIRAYAGSPVPANAEGQILERLLVEAQAQTRYLKTINTVAQLVGLLLILGIAAGCLVVALGGSLLP